MIPHVKQFSGRRYYLESIRNSPDSAADLAYSLRSSGYNARISIFDVAKGRKYAVYSAEKLR